MWAYNDREWGRRLGDYQPGELIAGVDLPRFPLKRPAEVADVANLLLFLASPTPPAYITGQADQHRRRDVHELGEILRGVRWARGVYVP